MLISEAGIDSGLREHSGHGNERTGPSAFVCEDRVTSISAQSKLLRHVFKPCLLKAIDGKGSMMKLCTLETARHSVTLGRRHVREV